MIIVNIFVTDISDTEQQMGVMLKETQDGTTAYMVYHNYPKGTPDSTVKSSIQAKIDAFVIPQISDNRENLITDLMQNSTLGQAIAT